MHVPRFSSSALQQLWLLTDRETGAAGCFGPALLLLLSTSRLLVCSLSCPRFSILRDRRLAACSCSSPLVHRARAPVKLPRQAETSSVWLQATYLYCFPPSPSSHGDLPVATRNPADHSNAHSPNHRCCLACIAPFATPTLCCCNIYPGRPAPAAHTHSRCSNMPSIPLF